MNGIFHLDDQRRFARLSEDYNPLHLDPVYSRRLLFGEPVVHGIHLVFCGLEHVLGSFRSPIVLKELKAAVLGALKLTRKSPLVVFYPSSVFVDTPVDGLVEYAAAKAAYSASKGGLASMTFTLAQELKPYGIRCVAIAPGMVETAMAEKGTDELRKKMLEHVAAGRMGSPEEIAHGVLFCIENDFFNARVLELDGGAFG